MSRFIVILIRILIVLISIMLLIPSLLSAGSQNILVDSTSRNGYFSLVESQNRILQNSNNKFYVDYDTIQVDTTQTSQVMDSTESETKFEPMPIISYDTDTGVGFGGKAFLLNYLGYRESLDVIIFFSTKGEKWIRTVVSIPDFELRQGTVYSLAFDFMVDYDKWVAYNFFGIGSQSKFEDREIYTRELIEISGIFNRGFSEIFVGRVGLKYKRIESGDFDPEGQLEYLPSEINHRLVEYNSLYFNFRYDSRDSFIHPSQGLVFQGDLEWAPDLNINTLSFYQWTFWFQYYTNILFRKTILASRFGIANILGSNIPLQLLIPLGGNRTLRGYPQDRFLDKTAALINLEIRYPIYARIGGLIGTDMGKVWPAINKMDLNNWRYNITLGLRYYLDTYVVRVDVGISTETMGIYFNFGHIF